METHQITPSELFQVLEVENKEEALKVFEAALAFLIYMKVGDELRISNATLRKTSDNFVHIDHETSGPEVIDFLAKKRVIRLPV